MRDLDPITDTALWLQLTRDVQAKFNDTMNDRVNKQLRLLDEGNANRDCPTWGALETKLRGYRPSPADLETFSTDQADDTEEADAETVE
jgi:hypothetical protein